MEPSRSDIVAPDNGPQPSDTVVNSTPQTLPAGARHHQLDKDVRADDAKRRMRGATTRWTFKCFVDDVDITTDAPARGPKIAYAACPKCLCRYRLDRKDAAEDSSHAVDNSLTNPDLNPKPNPKPNPNPNPNSNSNPSLSEHIVRYVVSFLVTPEAKPRAADVVADKHSREGRMPLSPSRCSRSIDGRVESDSCADSNSSWSSIAINLSDLESESGVSGMNGARSTTESPKIRPSIGHRRPLTRLRSGSSTSLVLASSSNAGQVYQRPTIGAYEMPSCTHTTPHVVHSTCREDLKSLLHTWWRTNGNGTHEGEDEEMGHEQDLLRAPAFLDYLRKQVERRDTLLKARLESLWRQKARVQRLEKQFQQRALRTPPESFGPMSDIGAKKPFVTWACARRREATEEDAKRQIHYWHSRQLLFRYLLSSEARHPLHLIRKLCFTETAMTLHNQTATIHATQHAAAVDEANEGLGRTIIELTERYLVEVVPAMIRQLFQEQILTPSMFVDDEDLAAKDLALSLKIEAISTKGVNVLRAFVDFPFFLGDLWKDAPSSFPASVVAREDMHRFLLARDPEEKVHHVNRAKDTLASFVACAQSFYTTSSVDNKVPHCVLIGLWYLLVLRSAEDAHGLLADVEFCKCYARWRGQDCAASLKGLSLALSLIEHVNAAMLRENASPQWTLREAWERNDWSVLV